MHRVRVFAAARELVVFFFTLNFQHLLSLWSFAEAESEGTTLCKGAAAGGDSPQHGGTTWTGWEPRQCLSFQAPGVCL